MRNIKVVVGLLLLVMLAVIPGLAACTSASIQAPTPPPTIVITTPSSGSMLPAGDVAVTVQVSNFNLMNKLGGSKMDGEGHIHYYIDVSVPTIPDQPAASAEGTYAASSAISYTWMGLTPGQHTISVQLVNNDHTPLSPPVVAEVTIMIEPMAEPSVMIDTPQDGLTIAAGDILVSTRVSDFKLVDKLGTANVPGEGHIHYYLDVTPPTSPGQPAVTAEGTYAASSDTFHTWPDVPAGPHTFSAQLVNNDHTPLEPPVFVQITTTATGPVEREGVTIKLTADELRFDKTRIVVPAGAKITVEFSNNESVPFGVTKGILHNFAVYESRYAKKVIFRGEIIEGPARITYEFTAPEKPGTYFFRCDVHTLSMIGDFVVLPPKSE